MKDAPDLYARCVSDDTLDGSSRAKRLGAYYTDEVIATFLVSWAVRDANDTVLDPSFGGGVFLTAAARRLDTLGGTGREQVYGVEVDADVHRQISRELHARQGIAPQQLIYADFFDVAAGSAELPRFDAVIGNPPYIRYQHFSGAAKERALARVASYGVTLSRLSSSWAPFVVHSAMQLREGGRLAMVVPIELAHAAYARPVLEHLTHTFRHVSLLTFRRPLFPHLSQETVLLLADGKDEPFVSLDWRDVEGIDALAALPTPLPRCHTLDRHALASGRDRLTTRFVSPDAQQLYRTLSKTSLRLGDVANISTGYVTGANTFFHLSDDDVRTWRLPSDVLRRAVFRSRALRGLRFTADDWHEAAQGGRAGYLLSLDKRPLPEFDAQTQRYLRDGERSGAPRSYKCRRREYWYHVPRVYVPDAFLSYMSGSRPTLVSNDAGATAPNTLYLVELYGLAPLGQWTLTLLWHSSLCELSCELEGHALGDGMLKLEPAEAKRVLIPNVSADLRDLAGDVDRLLRNEQPDKARTLVDQAVLQDGLGLSARDCRLLYETAAQLRERRLYRRRMARAARRRPKQ
ncbi:MAG: N-6 DNA methylase [Trueperaceae bacterium]|nr:N-6 DNA methylase [Trueperaceae bacterium]